MTKLKKNKKAQFTNKVSDILESYMNEHVAHKVVSKERQEYCVLVLDAGLGKYSISELTPEIILGYKCSRKSGAINGNSVGDSTLRRELNCLMAAINHAVKHRRINQSEVPYIELPVAAPPKDLWLNENELEQFIKCAESFNKDRLSRIYRFVLLASETASRKTAILNLQWNQVDLDAGLINFQNDGGQRTKKRRVAVPMSDLLKDLMIRTWNERTQDEFVLDNSNSIQDHFDKLKQLAVAKTGNELFSEITPHTLRHTWATQAARANVPMFEIAGVLGDTLTTVMKVYAHHCPDHLRGAVNFKSTALRRIV